MDNLLSYHRLQAELEEAKEEARIQAQEEIVARIQEAKVIIIIAELWTSGKSMGLVTVHFFFEQEAAQQEMTEQKQIYEEKVSNLHEAMVSDDCFSWSLFFQGC